MTKVTLNTVGDLRNTTTAQTTINGNFDTIETAFDNTLSRDGTAPNTMSAGIDMNSNRIINLPDAITVTEPITLGQVNTLNGGGTIQSIPSGGSINQHLTKTSGADYAVGWAFPAIANVTGLGTNVATFLATPSSANLRSALTDESGTGVAYFQGGDLGTPSAGVLTNATGTAASLTAGTATNAVNSGITNDNSTSATMFIPWVTASSGNLPVKVSSTGLTFNPSIPTLSIGTTPDTTALFKIAGGGTTLTSTNQFAMNFRPTFSSACTNNGFGIYVQTATVAASFTLSAGRGIYIDDMVKGAASTITTQYQLYIVAPTQGGTNYAINTEDGIHQFFSARATPAGGNATAGLRLSSTAGLGIYWGSGAPTLTAASGSLYIRTDNAGANLRLYSNTTGAAVWAAITSA